MTKAIWKFPLAITDLQTIDMPIGAKLLSVQMQGDTPQLWALCDPGMAKESRPIALYGTGNPIPDYPGEYIATVQIYDGALI